jgi:hypothetical protein
MTDCQTNASNYCLLKISHYDDPRKDKKKIIFVDPGVEDLKKFTEYPYIERLHYLAQGHLQSNEYLGIDYPSDMRKEMEEEFIRRSIENNWKYKDYLQYICGIQYKWCEYNDFVFRMKELEPIYSYKKKVVGLGNLCRLLLKRTKKDHPEYIYFQKIIDYIIQNKDKFYWIHIYGMSKFAILSFIPKLQQFCPNIIFSVDNTKWTKCGNKRLHDKYVLPKNQLQLIPTKHRCSGIACTKSNRDEFFIEYMNDIQKKGIHVKF